MHKSVGPAETITAACDNEYNDLQYELSVAHHYRDGGKLQARKCENHADLMKSQKKLSDLWVERIKSRAERGPCRDLWTL